MVLLLLAVAVIAAAVAAVAVAVVESLWLLLLLPRRCNARTLRLVKHKYKATPYKHVKVKHVQDPVKTFVVHYPLDRPR